MVAKITAYEESRRKRMEENKKRMEALYLHKLTQALKISNPIQIPSDETLKTSSSRENKWLWLGGPIPSRTNLLLSLLKLYIDRVRFTKAIDLSDRVFATDEARAKAMEKAEKVVYQSTFCRKNLPRRGDDITLIDEDADEYQFTYVAQKIDEKIDLVVDGKGLPLLMNC
ncbi:hypothetical protein NC651_031349 [Populus alba x Populus x berolinensis]|nr:hypothetical protein NC651_031349 [Populus alba x Populus x berolinensis]